MRQCTHIQHVGHLVACLSLTSAMLAGCAPPALDPDAPVTIEGRLLETDGLPAPGDEVIIVKVDSWWDRERNVLLDYVDLHDFIAKRASDTFTATADADGRFTLELRGRDVNRADGSAAAYLAALYQPPGELDLATMTPWMNFTASNPVWSVGDLKLWDGASGSTDGDEVTFSVDPSAPAGNSRDATMPIYMLAYNNDLLEWAAHSYQTTLSVPRAAFTGNDPAGFVMLTSSKDGSRTFTHRSSYREIGGTWAAPVRQNHLDYAEVELRHGDGSLFSNDNARDGSLQTPWYNFGTQETTFYVDLDGPHDVSEILIYNLVLTGSLANTTITVDVTTDNNFDGANWTNLITEGPGTYELQNWAYLGWTGVTTATFVKVHVSSSGGARYLSSVAEVDVLFEP